MGDPYEELTRVNQRFSTAEQQHDAEFLASVLDENLIFRRASGLIVTKKEYLSDLSKTTLSKAISENIEVDVKDESTLVTLVVTVEGTRDGQKFAGKFRNIRLFAKRDGEWRCIVWLNSRVG